MERQVKKNYGGRDRMRERGEEMTGREDMSKREELD